MGGFFQRRSLLVSRPSKIYDHKPPVACATHPMSPTPFLRGPTGATSCTTDLLYLRHQGLASVRVVRALKRLQPGFGWTVERLHQAEDAQLAFFDRSLQNSSLLAVIVGTLLRGSGQCVGLGRNQPQPPNCVLSLGVYADGYKPAGRGNVNIKVCRIDEEGELFPIRAHVPQCTLLYPRREMLNGSDMDVPRN